VKQVENHFIVAAADCTGHGVPGAFMSSMSYMFLNEIVVRDKTIQPDIILNTLREMIKEALQQRGHEKEQQDGLDITLVSINLINLQASFAGAYNDLWRIPAKSEKNASAQNEIIEYNADRQPISIYPKEKPFQCLEIQLEKGDRLYLFSDGYHSQFGGAKGEKIKSKRMKVDILAVSDLPMAEQKTKLEQKFHDWKGNHEQVDDVVILGIRI